MNWFYNYLAPLIIYIGRIRSRWLCLPVAILGVFLFWVMITWNRVPTFTDNIDICGSESALKDSIGVDISVNHPYFSLNNYNDEFIGFWSKYGKFKGGICFELNSDKKTLGNSALSDSTLQEILSSAKRTFPSISLDSIEAFYVITSRKELYGKMDNRKARNQFLRAKDDKGFSITNRKPDYQDGKCVDSLRIIAGLNKNISESMRVGYDLTIKSYLTRLLRMEDISQFNYSLELSTTNADIRSLEIDLGGPTNITGISPVPDIVEPTRIIYNTPSQIDEICKAKGVKMFCQSCEAANIQNIRLFLLTTLSSLCIGYTLKSIGVFILFGLRKIKNILEKHIKKNVKNENKNVSTSEKAIRRNRKKKKQPNSK